MANPPAGGGSVDGTGWKVHTVLQLPHLKGKEQCASRCTTHTHTHTHSSLPACISLMYLCVLSLNQIHTNHLNNMLEREFHKDMHTKLNIWQCMCAYCLQTISKWATKYIYKKTSQGTDPSSYAASLNTQLKVTTHNKILTHPIVQHFSQYSTKGDYTQQNTDSPYCATFFSVLN